MLNDMIFIQRKEINLLTELLAPAKDKNTAIEAINCGADAVYMGAANFGARKNAPNSIEDIKEVINYAHKYRVKVFITVNTILDNNELEQAVKLVKELDSIGVDAIIIQDLGLLKRIMEENISIPIHISTQCDNRDIEKIKFFNKLGVSRVVLARELSIKQIEQIHKANPDLELEAFVHGALCVSYSGQCYLSHYIGGRSANKGECAQPCRKKYTLEDCNGKIIAKDFPALCLKDFNASKHLKQMIDAGIFSFKIEGRLKEKNYVKNITAYYRQELDKYSDKTSSGRCLYPFTPNPEKSFNRGFTDYFLEKRTNCFNFVSPKSRGEYLGEITEIKGDCFVLNTNKEIHAQDGITINEEGCLVNKVLAEGNKVTVYPAKKLDLKIGAKVYRNIDVKFEKELLSPVKRQIGVGVGVNEGVNEGAEELRLVLTDEDNVSITLPILYEEVANNQEKMKETFIKQFSKTGNSDFYIKNNEINAQLPFIPVSAINELRRKAFDILMEKRVKNYKRAAQKPLKIVPYYLQEVDYRANVYNDKAKSFYEECGCKVTEPAVEAEQPTHEYELMRTKHCLKYAFKMCKSPVSLRLRDEYNQIYPLKFDCEHCEMVIHSPARHPVPPHRSKPQL